MNKVYYLFLAGFLGSLSLSAQEIIPFPDLSEHYNFRNSGGESVESTPYEHLDVAYRSALEKMDDEIALLNQKLRENNAAGKDQWLKELETLQSKRSALLKEAELQSDLLQLHP